MDCLLKECCASSDDNFKNMSMKMKEKCEKYWGDHKRLNVMLFISAILDPRYKWDCVDYGICQMYKSNEALNVCNSVKKAFKNMHDEYKGSQVTTNSTSTLSGGSTSCGVDGEPSIGNKGIIRARYKKLKATKDDVDAKTELKSI